MICTGEVPCLFSSLAKITNYVHVCPTFQAFLHFESWAFFGNGGDKPYTKTVKHHLFSQFLKVQQ